MSKQNNKQVNSLSINTLPVDLRDAGYQQARTNDATRSLVQFVMTYVPSFPESITDESKAELIAGYQLRFSENNPVTRYAVIDGQYLPVDALNADTKALEHIDVSVAYVMSFTQQAFGALKNDKSPTYNPALHGVVKALRDKVSKYCSNRYNDLVKAAKAIIKEREGKTATRTAALEFSDYVVKQFDVMETRCKTAKVQRGDETANIERFNKAKVAFYAVWNHAE